MPWTVADVDKHKKDLTPAEKKQWVEIANSYLRDCIKKGGTDATCAPGAVRRANGVVGNSAQVYFEPPEAGDAPAGVKSILQKAYNNCRSAWVKDHPNDRENAGNKTSCSKIAWHAVKQAGWHKGADDKWVKSPSGHSEYELHIPNEGYEIRETQYQSRKHLIVPVVMMTEGVHEGSSGPILHLEEEFGKIIGAWNGIPIVIDHPKIDGQFVSANSPEYIDGKAVGRVYNSHVEDKKLKAEAWIDEDKLRQTSPVALAAILNKEPLDVSIGVFSEDEQVTGTYKKSDDEEEQQYDAISRNLRPDHLALLPGGVGACSWEDGCGVRSNEKGGNEEFTDDEISVLKKENIESIIESNADQGYRELVEAAQRKLDGMDSSNVYHRLHEIYDSYLIYEANMRVGGSKLFKQEYNYAEGQIELKGNPTEVVRKVEYVAISNNNLIRTKFNFTKKEVNKMSDPKCTPCVEAKVKQLIANSKGKFTEDKDKEKLQELEEAQLDVLIEMSKVSEPIAPKSELTEEDKADLAFARRYRKEKRARLIEGIQGNTNKETWPDEMLKGMSDDYLERLFESVKKEDDEEVDHSLATSSKTKVNQRSVMEPLLPTGVELEKETVK